MLHLDNIDLTLDPAAAHYLKTEVVQVVFAPEPGELISLEGPNNYHTGDAIITGCTGDRWSVDRHRFDAKYQAVAPTQDGNDGDFTAKPVPVLAKQIHEPFTAARSAGRDVLRGEAGDWLMQYGPGDFGVCGQSRFARVYQRVS
ncbi:MAG: PGDYG domain-containing protein [Fluviibacter phosphoraccumulans]